MQKMRCAVLIVIALAALAVSIEAHPSWSRQKRVSDQRLAELETLLALARLKGRMVSVPVGYGFIDPAKIGRKKRFTDDSVEESDTSDDVEEAPPSSRSISDDDVQQVLMRFLRLKSDPSSLEEASRMSTTSSRRRRR